MKEPRRIRLNAAKRGKVKVSPWESVPDRRRFWAMHETYRILAGFTPRDPRFPMGSFGVIVDKSFPDFEERAYEEILHRFDEMLTRQANAAGGAHQRGIVIHDSHIIERNLQQWTDTWRRVAGRIGVLTHMAECPLLRGLSRQQIAPSCRLRQLGNLALLRPRRSEMAFVPLALV
jgi:hypothetical protein